MSKKKGTNNKKNAKAQEKVQNLEQNEVVEKDINKPNETKTSDNESTKVSKEAKKVDVAKADKKAKKDTKTKKHFFKDFKAELKKVICLIQLLMFFYYYFVLNILQTFFEHLQLFLLFIPFFLDIIFSPLKDYFVSLCVVRFPQNLQYLAISNLSVLFFLFFCVV